MGVEHQHDGRNGSFTAPLHKATVTLQSLR